MKRRQFLATTASIATLPLTFSPTTAPRTGMWWSPPQNAVDHSGGRFSWSVQVGDNDIETLESWAEDGENRRIVRSHPESGHARIVASTADIGLRLRDRVFDDGLATASWVTSIEIDIERELAEPVTPQGPSAWNGLTQREQFAMFLSGVGSRRASREGVAFDRDMEETSLSASLSATGVDPDFAPSADGLTIAIVDTGINDGAVFEDDAGTTRILATSKEFLSEDEEEGLDAVEDGNGHGSWCASAIAANRSDEFRGYLPAADLLGIKALDDDGSGSTTSIEHAILYAADEGADIINLSLGSPQWSAAIDDALDYAVRQGSIPVAAVGNDRQATRWVAHPASSDDVISVGATTVESPSEAKSAYFSNIGPHPGTTDISDGRSAGRSVDIAAPGTETTALVPRTTGSQREETLSGTSMAAPKVAGVIGLVLADAGPTDLEELRELLQDTAEPVPNAAIEEVGAGMINAENALDDEEPTGDQDDVETSAASDRGAAYSGLSAASGGLITRTLF